MPVLNCLVTCSDYRLRVVEQILKENLGERHWHDCLTIPGGAAATGSIIKYYEVLHGAHRPYLLVLCAHEDCKGGGTEQGLKRTLSLMSQLIPYDCIVRAFWFFCHKGTNRRDLKVWVYREVTLDKISSDDVRFY